MTLVEFLLARIAEDEAVARGAWGVEWEVSGTGNDLRVGSEHVDVARDWSHGVGAGSSYRPVSEHVARWDPARVLAECEAKRQIVEVHSRCDVHDRPGDECDACKTCGDGSVWPCDTLRFLALPYVDHQDYDEAWRP